MNKSKLTIFLSIQIIILLAHVNQSEAIIHRLQRFEFNDVENIKNIFTSFKKMFERSKARLFRKLYAKKRKDDVETKRYFHKIITDNISY